MERPEHIQVIDTDRPCWDAHRVGNIIPDSITDEEEKIRLLDGKTCNCGKLRYVAEMCSCPNKSEMRLKTYPVE